MSAWTYRSSNGNADPKIVSPRPRIPSWKGLGADSEEKHEPVSDIDTVAVDSLKALDPQWPIREEKHEPVSDIDTVAVDSLKALDPQWPIREADMAPGPIRCHGRCADGSWRRTLPKRRAFDSLAVRAPRALFSAPQRAARYAPLPRKPITGIPGCCARAASGHTAAPPSSVM